MKLPALLVSDLHLTDAAADNYRWDVFRQVRDICQRNNVKTVCILGDTTDAKDYHSATLVNRLANEIARLAGMVREVVVLMGNHDYLKEGEPYLNFLNHMPGVRYVSSIYSDEDPDGRAVLWLPHTRNPVDTWGNLHSVDWYDVVFMHQTVDGSKANATQTMHGDGTNVVLNRWLQGGLPMLWSGDIHVPQTINIGRSAELNYVGSPYHVHFGDAFVPRGAVLIKQNMQCVDMPMQFPSRVSATLHGIKDLRRVNVQPNDQVKLKVCLTQAEAEAWPRTRAACLRWADENEVLLASLQLTLDTSTRRRLSSAPGGARSPQEALLRYIDAEDLGAAAHLAALEIME